MAYLRNSSRIKPENPCYRFSTVVFRQIIQINQHHHSHKFWPILADLTKSLPSLRGVDISKCVSTPSGTMEPSYQVSPCESSCSRKFETITGQSLIEFYRSYLNFAYCLFIVPFRYKFNVGTGRYALHTNKVHTVCVCFYNFV